MSAVPQEAHASSAATHQLYEQYGRQIYAYCLQRLRSREEAEDAVQTTFLNAFRALQRGTMTEFRQAWLFKIAQNVCLERREASGKRARLESPSDLQLLQDTAPAHAPQDSEQLIGVEAALQRIPANQRKAILLREWQGLSYREIGDELGLTQAAVEMLIFRARRSLATALEQPEETQTKKQRRAGGRALNAGSLVTALKTMFTGGAAVKAVAVAVTAGAAAVAIVAPPKHMIARRLHRHVEAPAAAAPAAPVTRLASVVPHGAAKLAVSAAHVHASARTHVARHVRAAHSSRAFTAVAVSSAGQRVTQQHATPSDVVTSAPSAPPASAPAPSPAPSTPDASTVGSGAQSSSLQTTKPKPPPAAPVSQPRSGGDGSSASGGQTGPGEGSGSGDTGQGQAHTAGQGEVSDPGPGDGGGDGRNQSQGTGHGQGHGKGQGWVAKGPDQSQGGGSQGGQAAGGGNGDGQTQASGAGQSGQGGAAGPGQGQGQGSGVQGGQDQGNANGGGDQGQGQAHGGDTGQGGHDQGQHDDGGGRGGGHGHGHGH